MNRKRLKRKKPPEVRRRPGRPSKYDPEVHPRQVIALMKMGNSMTQTATKMGLLTENLVDWARDNSDFSEALIYGNQACETWWIENLMIGMHSQHFKVAAWAMFMGNKFKWRNPKNIQQEEEPKKVVHERVYILDISNLSDKQLDFLDQLHGLEEKQQLSAQATKALPARLSEEGKGGKKS